MQYVEALQDQLADLESSAGARCAACSCVHGGGHPAAGRHCWPPPLCQAVAHTPAAMPHVAICRLPRSTLELYAARVEALAAQLQPANLPAFCTGVAPQPGAAAALHQVQVQPTQQVQQQQQDTQQAWEGQQQAQGPAVGPAAGGAQATAAAAAAPPRLAVPAPPVAVARTPQLPVKPVVATAEAKQPSRAATAAGQPARPADTAPASAVPTSGRLQTQQQLHVRAVPGGLQFDWVGLLWWPLSACHPTMRELLTPALAQVARPLCAAGPTHCQAAPSCLPCFVGGPD